jgi:hypothetical protein
MSQLLTIQVDNVTCLSLSKNNYGVYELLSQHTLGSTPQHCEYCYQAQLEEISCVLD